jgi:hypothetical protein
MIQEKEPAAEDRPVVANSKAVPVGAPCIAHCGTPAGCVKTLPDLVGVAQRKASRCAALAASCQVRGDRVGFLHWRRLFLKHQAVLWSLTHQEPGRSNGTN